MPKGYAKAHLIQVVRTVSCGEHHVGAVSEVGVLYTWGRGQNGRLGHGGQENELLPKPVEANRLVGPIQGDITLPIEKWLNKYLKN